MLRTGQLLHPASTPASQPDPGASLPGTLTSPRTGLTPAGHRELALGYVMTPSFGLKHPAELLDARGSGTNRFERFLGQGRHGRQVFGRSGFSAGPEPVAGVPEAPFRRDRVEPGTRLGVQRVETVLLSMATHTEARRLLDEQRTGQPGNRPASPEESSAMPDGGTGIEFAAAGELVGASMDGPGKLQPERSQTDDQGIENRAIVEGHHELSSVGARCLSLDVGPAWHGPEALVLVLITPGTAAVRRCCRDAGDHRDAGAVVPIRGHAAHPEGGERTASPKRGWTAHQHAAAASLDWTIS